MKKPIIPGRIRRMASTRGGRIVLLGLLGTAATTAFYPPAIPFLEGLLRLVAVPPVQ